MSTSLYDTDFLARLTMKRLAELNRTRAKVEALERRADALAEAALERRKADLLDALSARAAALSPALRDMSFHVAELKSYLQSVYDADLLGDSLVQQLASEHCIGYTVRLLDLLSEPSKYASKGVAGVLELGTSTLAMFAARPALSQAVVDAGAVSVLIKLLSPLYPTVAVVNTANAIGHLSSFEPARLAFRASGGVGALVRLLRPDVDASAQTASAATLSLLGSRDAVVQDSVRYLGGLSHLVDLLASHDNYLAETARYALLALRHGNVKNQAEIITSIRSNSALAKDFRKLDAASELLRFEDTPLPRPPSLSSSSSLLGGTYNTAAQVRALIDNIADYAAVTGAAPFSPRSTSPRPGSAATTFRASQAPKTLSKFDYLPASPTATLTTRYGLDSPTSSLGRAGDWSLRSGLNSSLVEVETELLRKKHLARFSHDELVLLLEEMGFDSLDLRGVRLHRIDGTSLLAMSEDFLLSELVLPRGKVRKLRALQRAAALFDHIATLPRQGKISEIEMRLYLAGQGASSTEVNKIVKLCRTLVRTDKYDFISFWDFVTSYDWIAQALRIYNVPA